MTHAPAIRHALPLGSENRWSDLLAVLVETDPAPFFAACGLPAPAATVRVLREHAADSKNRPDLVLQEEGRPDVVVEVKVLSGFGARQLARYVDAHPEARAYVLVSSAVLVLDVSGDETWTGATWEDLLDAYSASSDGWVAQTAQAWRVHLRSSMPTVDGGTVWDDLRDGEDFVIALRARMSWVFGAWQVQEPLEQDLVASSAGVSWVARMHVDAARPGYRIMVEAEENLPVRDFPKYAGRGLAPKGVGVKVTLLQDDVETSAGFDWDYLLSMWPLMEAARSDWVTNTARPKAEHDRNSWLAMVAKGGPRYLGIGFGEAQTRIMKQCMFGARFQLPPDATLQQVVDTLSGLESLALRMAEQP